MKKITQLLMEGVQNSNIEVNALHCNCNPTKKIICC